MSGSSSAARRRALLAAAGLADYAEVVFQFEQLGDALAHHRMVVHQQQANRFVGGGWHVRHGVGPWRRRVAGGRHEAEEHLRAVGRARFEAQLAAEGLAALLHDGKPIVAAAVLLRIKPTPSSSTAMLTWPSAWLLRAHPGPLRLRMANHVGERPRTICRTWISVGAQRHVLQAVVQFDRHLAALAELATAFPSAASRLGSSRLRRKVVSSSRSCR